MQNDSDQPDTQGDAQPDGKAARRRWIAVSAAGTVAFATLVTAVSGVVFTVLGLHSDRSPATAAAAHSRTVGQPLPGSPVPAGSDPPMAATSSAAAVAGSADTAAPPAAGDPVTPDPPAATVPTNGQGGVLQPGPEPSGTPRPRPSRSTARPARSAPLRITLHPSPADGGTAFNRNIDITGSITGKRPAGPLWLVWAAEPKPTDPKQVDEYYAKDEIHPSATGAFSFPGLTMGDTSSYSVGRTWRVFVAVAEDAAAQSWLLQALANDGHPAWDGNRLELPSGVHPLGDPISVRRTQ
jgi:hypothetical protein